MNIHAIEEVKDAAAGRADRYWRSASGEVGLGGSTFWTSWSKGRDEGRGA